jgi:restriction system protein
MATITRATRRRRKVRIDGWGATGLGVLAIAIAGYLHHHPGVAVALGVTIAASIALYVIARRRLRRRKPRAAGRRFLKLSPTSFEDAVADLMRRSGVADARRTGGAGDLGADVVGWDRAGRKVVTQCKRYAVDRAVGSEDMQRFMGTARVHHCAGVALFVTTSRFTKPALDYARQHDIRTVDGEQLAEWDRTGYAPWL